MIYQLIIITIAVLGVTIIMLLCEFFLRFFKNKLRKENFDNIKRVPNVELKRSYEINSYGNENQNSRKCDILGWDMIKNSEISVKIKVPYFEKNYYCKYIINNYGARSNSKKTNPDDKYFGIFGCSISYGFALNEESTFANLVQKEMLDYNYLNFSVPGYSLYQSLIKYKLKSKDIKFDFIILGIHQDLERRNTCSISWADIINNYWKIPRTYKIVRFFNFSPTNKSKIEIINILKFFIGNIRFIQILTMRSLLLEFQKECIKNNTKLYIICFDKYNSIYSFLTKNKFNWNSAHLNLEQKNFKNEYIYQLMPWDNHPNMEANLIFAKKILELINHSKNNSDIFKPKISNSKDEQNTQEFIYTLW